MMPFDARRRVSSFCTVVFLVFCGWMDVHSDIFAWWIFTLQFDFGGRFWLDVAAQSIARGAVARLPAGLVAETPSQNAAHVHGRLFGFCSR